MQSLQCELSVTEPGKHINLCSSGPQWSFHVGRYLDTAVTVSRLKQSRVRVRASVPPQTNQTWGWSSKHGTCFRVWGLLGIFVGVRRNVDLCKAAFSLWLHFISALGSWKPFQLIWNRIVSEHRYCVPLKGISILRKGLCDPLQNVNIFCHSQECIRCYQKCSYWELIYLQFF